MATNECRLQSMLGDLCRKKRGLGVKGTIPEHWDAEHDFCALADNDSHVYWQEIKILLQTFTVDELLHALTMGRNIFKKTPSCARSKEMTEFIQTRIDLVKAKYK